MTEFGTGTIVTIQSTFLGRYHTSYGFARCFGRGRLFSILKGLEYALLRRTSRYRVY